MSATGDINARVLKRGPRSVVEVALGNEVFHVTLSHEWNDRANEDLESRAIVVLREERDRHPSKSLHDLDHQVAEPFINNLRPEPPGPDAPGYLWSFQLPGEAKQRHYLRMTVEAAAALPFDGFPQISRIEVDRLLHAWLKLNHVTGSAQVSEAITITSTDVNALRGLLNG